MKIMHKAFVLSVGICASLVSSALMAAPLINKPVFACGSGANSKLGQPGGFRDRSSDPGHVFDYTFDRTSETVFEGGQVKPIALSPDGNLLFVANTPANCLEIYDVRGVDEIAGNTDDKLQLVSSVSVGVEPVSVAVRTVPSTTNLEVWVVNHISDSVSVVTWTASQSPLVRRTLLVGDEPRDVVFGDRGTCDASNAQDTAFITTAYRGKHHTGFDPKDLLAYEKADGTPIGRASVWVYDANNTDTTPQIVPLFAMPARALAVSPNGCKVYAASLQSGNQTTLTVVSAATPLIGGVISDAKRILFGEQREQTAEPVGTRGVVTPRGNQIIVKYDDPDNDPTDDDGVWRDGDIGADWSASISMKPADYDVFEIDPAQAWTNPTTSVVKTFRGVGTTLFNMVVNPAPPYNIYVSNIEARNEKRYVSGVVNGVPTLQGHFVEHRITTLYDASGLAVPRHLNDHILDFLNWSNADKKSMAQPTDMVITADGAYVYVANFGSKSIAKIPTSSLDSSGSVNNTSAFINLETLAGGPDPDPNKEGVIGGGPAGLALNTANTRLYVYSRFDNAISIINTGTDALVNRVSMFSPESSTVKNGRPYLYDASITSKNGTGSCGSCHIYGDMDMLAWDLGNPFDGKPAFNALRHSLGEVGNKRGNRILKGFLPPNAATASYGQLDDLLTGNLPMVNADVDGDYHNDLSTFDSWLASNTVPPNKAPNVYFAIDRAENSISSSVNAVTSLLTEIPATRLNGNSPNRIRAGSYLCVDGTIKANAAEICSDTGEPPYFVKWTSSCGVGDWSNFPSDCAQYFVSGHPGDVTCSIGSEKVKTSANWTAANKKCRALVAGKREVLLEPSDEDTAFGNGTFVLMQFFEGATVIPGGLTDQDATTADTTSPNNFHPLKGPMTTQTLRGIADSGAMHWRGDKSGGDSADGGGHCIVAGVENCDGTAVDPQELRAFKQFNEAFMGLLGRASKLTTTADPVVGNQMDKFTQFVMRLTLPPNPIRNLNDTLPTQQAIDGKEIFHKPAGAPGATSLGQFGPNFGTSCISCHALNKEFNLFGTDKTVTFETSDQFIKVPHLRNAYQKVGMFYTKETPESVGNVFDLPTRHAEFRLNKPQVAGFGYGHDGVFDTVTNFFNLQFRECDITGNCSSQLSREHARWLAMFMMAFDNNVAPIVGQQVTLRQSDFSGDVNSINSVVAAQMDVIFDQALAGNCDLIKTDIVNGSAHTFLMKGPASICGSHQSGVSEKVCFDSDYNGPSIFADFTDGVTKQLIFDGSLEEATFTCLPKGNIVLNNHFDAPASFTRLTTDPSHTDEVVWDFNSVTDIRGLTLERPAVGYPQHVKIYGGADGDPIDSVDELLTDAILLLPANIGDDSDQIQIKLSTNGSGYRYYKLKIVDCNGAACPSGAEHTTVFNESWVYAVSDGLDDTDGDGWSDSDEVEIHRTNPTNSDTDGDLVLDNVDPYPLVPLADIDGDGLNNIDDAYPLIAISGTDTDNDGAPDVAVSGMAADNCISAANVDQLDTDLDSQGNACDSDDDNDGWPDVQENVLGNNPVNRLDPLISSVTSLITIGVDNYSVRDASITLASVWWTADGSWDTEGTLADSIIDVHNACWLDKETPAAGVHCLFYGTDPAIALTDGVKLRVSQYDLDTNGGYACVLGEFVVAPARNVKCVHLDGSLGPIDDTNVVSMQEATDIAAGPGFGCAIQSGNISCWNSTSLITPVGNGANQIPDSITFSVVSAKSITAGGPSSGVGGAHLCAIMTDGTVQCWGSDNAKGQLNVPAVLTSATTAKGLKIAAGDYHTCALSGDYGDSSTIPRTDPWVKAICWGANDLFQSSPPPKFQAGDVTAVDIEAGSNSTCVTLAGVRTSIAALKCWPIGLATVEGVPVDSDGDGLSDVDELDIAVGAVNKTNPQLADTDGDNVSDSQDAFSLNEYASLDNDLDGMPDTCTAPCTGLTEDLNDDGDTFIDTLDNCSLVTNQDQLNTDGDAFGNACDGDDDNDGWSDQNDTCLLKANPLQANADDVLDGFGNACDIDLNNSNTVTAVDLQLAVKSICGNGTCGKNVIIRVSGASIIAPVITNSASEFKQKDFYTAANPYVPGP